MQALNGYVHLEMRCTVRGLPQARIIANKLLRKRLMPHDYYECAITPGLWKHKMRQISFTFIVDNFGVKYIEQNDGNHLIRCMKQTYEVNEDCSGNLCCRIKLDWDYNPFTLNISKPGYIKKLLLKYKHLLGFI
jgi:hypothetical protein